MKYQMTAAAAKRIAGEILKTGYPTSYDEVIAAVGEELNNPETRIDDLVVALRQDEAGASGRRAIELIAMACATEARRLNEKHRDLRRGLSGLGVIFQDDVKPEALKE